MSIGPEDDRPEPRVTGPHHHQYLPTMCHPDNGTHSIWIMTKIRSNLGRNINILNVVIVLLRELKGEKRRMLTISLSLIWGQTLLCHPTEN